MRNTLSGSLRISGLIIVSTFFLFVQGCQTAFDPVLKRIAVATEGVGDLTVSVVRGKSEPKTINVPGQCVDLFNSIVLHQGSKSARDFLEDTSLMTTCALMMEDLQDAGFAMPSTDGQSTPYGVGKGS